MKFNSALHEWGVIWVGEHRDICPARVSRITETTFVVRSPAGLEHEFWKKNGRSVFWTGQETPWIDRKRWEPCPKERWLSGQGKNDEIVYHVVPTPAQREVERQKLEAFWEMRVLFVDELPK